MDKKTFLIKYIILMLLMFGCGKKEQNPTPETLINIVEARNLGLAYLEENRLDEAEREFLKVVENAPNDAMGYSNLGIIYMRTGQYKKAEAQVKRAIQLMPDSPDINLIMAEVYEASGDDRQAIEVLERSLKNSPSHVRSLYRAAEVYGRMSYSTPEDKSLKMRQEEYLAELINVEPGSVPARLQLIETLLVHQLTDSALAHMESIIQQIPEPPKEATQAIKDALKAMQTGDNIAASRFFRIVHNVLKVTARYQADLIKLRGPGGANSGFPILNFSENLSQRLEDESAVLKTLRFSDATSISGINVVNTVIEGGKVLIMAVGDLDGDNAQDLYCSVSNGTENKIFLLRQEFGEFLDVAPEAGVGHTGIDFDASFSDLNNDGYLDLLVANSNGFRYYRSNGEGSFEDLSALSQLGSEKGGRRLLNADFDHDGDIDVYIVRNGLNHNWRNNLDGTFFQIAEEMKVDGGNSNSLDGAFGDFDDDGDLDLILVNDIKAPKILSNLRQGQFKTLENIGFKDGGGSTIIVGDYNNDGALDVFVSSLAEKIGRLYRNEGEGRFSEVAIPLTNPVSDAEFLDFDNDGHLDLLTTGMNGTNLYHNVSEDIFEDVSHILPDGNSSGQKVDVIDYNLDGDLDILLINEDGKLKLYRNDGGNVNKYLKVRLVGLRTGSGKNNHFGVGSKIEIRAGDLYQSRLVTSEVTHFGIGQRLKADVMRIIWTNGVPQNLFYPGSDQDIVEEQILKGSCPFLYAWNGERFEFVKDILWRSALGMPLGIMGGEMAYAFANSTEEYVKIPGNALLAKNGLYTLQLTMELWETNYYDDLKLHVVDHPEETEIYVDEKFAIPPYPLHKVYTVSDKRLPLSAIDGEGNNLMPLLEAWDYNYVSNFILTDFQGITEPHDLILDLGDLNGADDIILFLHGWLFPSDASINVNRSQSSGVSAFPPRIQVPDEKGKWKTVIGSINFPNGKDKTSVVDMSGKFLSDDYRIRLQTSMQIYWDHIFFTIDEPNVEVIETILSPASADLHYRGFSRMYRKGGRYGPHWFDYSTVTEGPKWRDLIGKYTRYGDVTSLLQSPDNLSVIMNSGDELTVNFSELGAPKLREGWKRDFLLYSDGWLKDGDLNTATGKTVEPLPFQGLTNYPYDDDKKLPDNDTFLLYMKNYNNREVKGERFKQLLSKNRISQR